MTLADEIARVRMRAHGAEINARHRRSRETAARMTAALKEPTPPDGVHPRFQQQLDQARAKAKADAAKADSKPRAPLDRIEQLVREGKLPARPGDHGVGYEPTPEEILGDLAGEQAPEGTEDLPDAATVLSGDTPAASGDWGAPPGAAASESVSVAPGAPAGAPGLARSAGSVHSKRRRGK